MIGRVDPDETLTERVRSAAVKLCAEALVFSTLDVLWRAGPTAAPSDVADLLFGLCDEGWLESIDRDTWRAKA